MYQFNLPGKEYSILEMQKRDSSIPNVFFYRVLEDDECVKPVRVLAPGEFEDVILRPSNRTGCVGNVPYRLKNAWWYEWGYSGNGPMDTAINILYHFSGSEMFARNFTYEFVEVLMELPNRTEIAISARFILQWIDSRKGKEPEVGSYDFPVLCPKDQAWEFGSWEMIPRPLYVE